MREKSQLVTQTDKSGSGNAEDEGVDAAATADPTMTSSSVSNSSGTIILKTKERKYIECNGLEYHSDMPGLDTSPRALSSRDYNPNHALWLSFCSVLVYRKLSFIEQCVLQVWGKLFLYSFFFILCKLFDLVKLCISLTPFVGFWFESWLIMIGWKEWQYFENQDTDTHVKKKKTLILVHTPVFVIKSHH